MSLLNEADKNRKHPLRKELNGICKILYGSSDGDAGYIPYKILDFSRKRANELLNATLKRRKQYYKTSVVPQFKGCVKTYSGLEYELIKIPFRYIEEFLMVFGLMFHTIKKSSSYPILKHELSKCIELLATVKLTPRMRDLLSLGIERFDQTYLTKFSYDLYKLPSRDINEFLLSLYTAMEQSRVILNLFTLSYEYLMVEKRNDIVLETCYGERSTKYKFKFDAFYWSKAAFVKVIKTKTPSPQKR